MKIEIIKIRWSWENVVDKTEANGAKLYEKAKKKKCLCNLSVVVVVKFFWTCHKISMSYLETATFVAIVQEI